MSKPTPNTETSEMVGLARRLRHLVSLDAPENGGPFQGTAARACMEAMTEAADALDAAEQRASSDVKVKGLEWEQVADGWFGTAGTETRFVRMGWREDAPYEFAGDCFATLHEAQSAAQTHLNQCILSALQNGGGDA